MTVPDIQSDIEALDDGPDREGRTSLRGYEAKVRRQLRCFCCDSYYPAGSWTCCSAPPGKTSGEWADLCHRFEDKDGRKRAHCPRHPCPDCLAGGVKPAPIPGEPGPPAPSTGVKPFDPDDGKDWKQIAAGDVDKLREEIPF